MQEEQVELVGQDEEGRQESLFYGLIDSAELKNVGDYAVLELQAVSGIWQMDVEKKSRSFQDMTRTYRDITEEIAKEYSFTVRWNLPDGAIPCPLIQYQETDYQFLGRIVSHLGGRLLPEDYGKKKEVNVGLPQKKAGQIDLAQHKYAALLYKKPGRTSVKDRRQGYQIYGREFIRVGETVTISGREYGVMDSRVSFAHNSIETCISVYPRVCFQADKIRADQLKGVVIEGEVLQTKGEVLRLHLDIDDKQDAATAYDYPWWPITGNMLYCMPEKGQRLRSTLIKMTRRTQKQSITYGRMGNSAWNWQIIIIVTLQQAMRKRLYMKPVEMGLVHREDQNAEIALSDSSMLRAKTINKLSILAEGQVQFQAKSVTVTAPKEITLVRKNLTKPTVINLCNAFDAIGCTGNFAATPQMVAEKQKHTASQTGGGAPMPGLSVEKYSLEGVITRMLANIPAEDYGSAVMEVVAGSMPVLTKVGK